MADVKVCRYVFMAVDRSTRRVFIAIKSKKTAAAARPFFKAPHGVALFRIVTLLTDHDRELTDRDFARREKDARGEHEFGGRCQALGIGHRLTRPKHPQTNGMVERLNGRPDHVLKSNRFN